MSTPLNWECPRCGQTWACDGDNLPNANWACLCGQSFPGSGMALTPEEQARKDDYDRAVAAQTEIQSGYIRAANAEIDRQKELIEALLGRLINGLSWMRTHYTYNQVKSSDGPLSRDIAETQALLDKLQ